MKIFTLLCTDKFISDNRWVILSKQIPWEHIEQKYSFHFSTSSNAGCPAKSARVALGALIIKERLGATDRETVQQIAENPYLQYFLGFSEYKNELPFDHSLMTHFRKRFDKETLAGINALIVDRAMESRNHSQESSHTVEDDEPPSLKGKLIVDATCAPADVAYPTDLNLLNEARKKTEAMIDAMHAPYVGQYKKPRTYRHKARKDYLTIAKQKQPSYKKVRKAIGKQLRYLKRNLRNIETMVSAGLLKHLSDRQYRDLLVIKELFRQQQLMYENRSRRIEDRIVSISQPHLRPIVRGKARNKVEFGAKVSVSLVEGFSFVDRIDWGNYNESCDLIAQIENYYKRFGYYPESVHADKIYRTRKNRAFCQARGIRLSGPPLGRPKKVTELNAEQSKQTKRQYRQDELDRIAIEGKFGQGKRRFSLARVMAKLAATSEVVIMVSFMVMNLEKILSSFLSFFLYMRRWLQTVVWHMRCLLAHYSLWIRNSLWIRILSIKTL